MECDEVLELHAAGISDPERSGETEPVVHKQVSRHPEVSHGAVRFQPDLAAPEVWGPSGVGNLMKPGSTGGVPTVVHKYEAGSPAYNPDNRGISPTLGFAWSPNGSGFLNKIVGTGGQTVSRGGFSIAYNRESMGNYTTIFGANPGGSIDASRSQDLGNLLLEAKNFELRAEFLNAFIYTKFYGLSSFGSLSSGRS